MYSSPYLNWCSKVKIAIIGIVGLPASYGGFETLVENLVEAPEMEATVYCSGTHYQYRPAKIKRTELVYLPINANGPISVLYDILSILHALVSGHRRLLVLGTSGALILPMVRLFFPTVQIVINIDGVEWKRDKWNGFAKWFLKFSEALAVKYSSVVIADNAAIADYVKNYYHTGCETIAYGGDHAVVETDVMELRPDLASHKDYAFSVCRIEPENNVELILASFAHTKLELVFVGNWQSSHYGKELLGLYSHYPNISLLDPIYELKILAAYRKGCWAYVHGHSAGGTNPSLVEMMHFDKPIVAFDCVYNRSTMEDHGSFFSTLEDLNEIMQSEGVLPGGAELGIVARQRYTWDAVREMYFGLFDK